jgi:glycogen debranching enzyme
MNIIINREECVNFDLASNKQWLETNLLNGYSSSTIYGLNNRRYHGLLAIPLGPDQEKMIILSKFEESIFIENQVYELSTNQFSGGIYPDGYKYLHKFSLNPFPKTLFLLENLRVEKTVFLLHDQHTLVIRYAYKDQGPAFNIILKPMISYRRINELTHESAGINTHSYIESGMVKIAPLENLPELKIYFNKGEYLPAPLWYHSYVYEMDTRRKQGYSRGRTEDLFNPGFLTCTLQPYETFDIYVSIDELTDFDYESIYRREKEFRRAFDSEIQYLSAPVTEISKKIEILTPIKTRQIPLQIFDFPENSHSPGKYLLSLFGLSIMDMNKQKVQDALLFIADKLQKDIKPDLLGIGSGSEKGKYFYADLPLLYINLIYYLYDFRIDQAFIESNLMDSIKLIIDLYSKNEIEFIDLDENGLLKSGNRMTETSWLYSRSAKSSYMRHGYLPEINAFWFNALKIISFFLKTFGKKRQAKKYTTMAERMKKSFHNKFWNGEKKQYYDHVNEQDRDLSFTVAQIFLVTLPFSLLDEEEGLPLLEQIEKQLLTPYGLRSLSPNESSYKGRLYSHKYKTDSSYYNGSVWPWTIALYVDAVLKFRGDKRQTLETLKKQLEPLGHFYSNEGMGNISSIFEGNPPHRRNGQICSSLNLTELLRAYYILYRSEKKSEGFSEYV